MLKSSTRQFEPDITRSGGVPSRVRFTIRCSKCPSTPANTATYEARRVVDDEVVANWFKQKGWVLGRNSRSFDVCPSCLGITITDENRLASHFKVSSKGNPVLSPAQLAEQVFSMSKKPKDDTAELLARHFGPKNENAAPAAPTDAPAARAAAPEAVPAAAPAAPPPKRERLGLSTLERRSPVLERRNPVRQAAPAPIGDTPQLLNVMMGIASDMQNTRAAMELMVEQLGQMVMLQNEQTSLHKEEVSVQKQQIEAVARLAPLVARSAEGVAGSMREAISQIRDVATPAMGAHEDDEIIEIPPIEAEAAPAAEPVQEGEVAVVKRPRGRPRKETQVAAPEAAAPEPVAPVAAEIAAAPIAEAAQEPEQEGKLSHQTGEQDPGYRLLTLALAFPHPKKFGTKEALAKAPEYRYVQNVYGNLKSAAKRGLVSALGNGKFRFTKEAADELRARYGSVAAPIAAAKEAPKAAAKSTKAEKSATPAAPVVTAAPAAEMAEASPVVMKRPRGRPRKHPRPEDVARQAVAAAPTQAAPAKAAAKAPTKQAAKAAAKAPAKQAAKAAAKAPVKQAAKATADVARLIAAAPEVAAPVVAHAETTAPVVMKRPRGRPRKHPRPEDVAAQSVAAVPAQTAAPAEVKAPKKAAKKAKKAKKAAASKPKAANVAAAQPELNLGIEPVAKRPRGRPRKHPRPEDLAAQAPAVAKPAKAAASVPAVAEEGVGPSPVAAKTAELLGRVNWGEKEWSRHVSVYSQADRKSPKKFSTVIQLERKFWDKAGFGPEDRLHIERNQDEVVITRAESGGVKPKKVGDTTVVIQANTLGNLNLKQVKGAADEDAMILRGSLV